MQFKPLSALAHTRQREIGLGNGSMLLLGAPKKYCLLFGEVLRAANRFSNNNGGDNCAK